LLDETLSGEGLLFDPDIVSVLTRLARRGITIILAAPNPVELHRIAARTINIVEGRVVAPQVESAGSRDSSQAEFELPSRPPRLVAEQS
jgi:ABC-type branched-subunit amino acid transport system ATPase component